MTATRTARPANRPRPPRRGVVLGAGGALGLAWMVGALSAYEDARQHAVGDADVIVGTSAGSILAALLRTGHPVSTIRRHQLGQLTPDEAQIAFDNDRDMTKVLPPMPRIGLGSPRLLVSSLRKPRQVPFMVALSSVLPEGKGNLDPVGRMIDAERPDGWPERDCWIVAANYSSGRRTVFGRPGAPQARLSEAVRASCSIPAWFSPVVIDGHRYIDGGVCSTTSADLVAGAGLDEVLVVAPMASTDFDTPSSPLTRAERQMRRLVTRRTLREIAKLHDVGTKVTFLSPGPEDLAVIGANMMDGRRRVRTLETSLRTSRRALRMMGELAS